MATERIERVAGEMRVLALAGLLDVLDDEDEEGFYQANLPET